jgi:hypothetical protein
MRQGFLTLHPLAALIWATCRFTGSAFGVRLSPSKPAEQPAVFGHVREASDLPDYVVLRGNDAQLRVAKPAYYFHHMRKAGGTTLRFWFQCLCGDADHCQENHEETSENLSDGERNARLEAECGRTHEGCSLPQGRFDEVFGKGSSFGPSVINLREPVARVESLMHMNLIDLNHTCAGGRGDGYHDPERDCKDTTAKGELLRTYGECFTMPGTDTPNTPMWNCWTNQYVKSLVGTNRRAQYPEPGRWFDVDEDDLEVAKTRLAGFSGVVISEWFGHPAVAEHLSKDVFHLGKTIPFPHANEGGHGGHGSSGTFTKKQRDWVTAENKYDSKLYEFAKELALKRLIDAGYRVSMSELDAAR